MAALSRCGITLLRRIRLLNRSRFHIAVRRSSNEILWRSIHRDAGVERAPVSIIDIYNRTKMLQRRDAEWSEIENSVIALAKNANQRSPMRIARLITHLVNLPYNLSDTPSIQSLIQIYIECYEATKEYPTIRTTADCDAYYQFVRYWLTRQMLAVPKICLGLLQKSTEPTDPFSMVNTAEYLTEFIDRFAYGRLATRLLSSHNVALVGIFASN